MKTIIMKKVFKSTSFLGMSLLIAIIGLNFQSCAELDQDPEEFSLPAGVFTNLDEMNGGIIGVYSLLNKAARQTTFFAPAWAGDDMTTWSAGNKADFREFDQRAVSSTNNRLLRNWNDILNAVNAINDVFESAEGIVGVDQDVVERYLGEAHFLRGMLFYQLARVHGRIPLPLSRLPDPNISRASLDDVYKQIESDLLLAEEKLPSIYPDVLAGAPRPNSGSARAMLARLYMDWAGFPMKDASKYALAASSAKTVIDLADTHGFGLVDDLEDLWTIAGRFSEESLFTIVYCAKCPANANANRKFGRVGNGPDLAGGWSETFAEIKFFEDFPEGPRKEATYRTDLDWESFTKGQKSPLFKKITGPLGDIASNNHLTIRNDFIMRYAEILLIYAEASGLSGNVTADSWEALNKIRRRAAGLPYAIPDVTVDLTSGVIEDLAFEESKWEFAGEYKRWFDLMRREKVEEVLSVRDNVSGSIPEHNPITGALDTSTYLAPLPADAVNQNPNLAL